MNIYSKLGINNNKSYDWIINEGLIGEKGNSPISPWYHVSHEELKPITEIFKSAKDENFILFARRQDCDDMAFFKIVNNDICGVYLIEGWIGNEFRIVQEYQTLWEWLKSVIDDLSELSK